MTNLLDTLKDKQLLTLDDDNNIILHPDGQYEFTTYPLPTNHEGCISITKDEYVGFLLGLYMFDESLSKVVDFVQPVEEIEVENEEN